MDRSCPLTRAGVQEEEPKQGRLEPGWHEQMRITLSEVPITYEQTSASASVTGCAAMEKMVWTSGPKQQSSPECTFH